MEFALYRYEFEVMEKKDSSASLFPDQWDNLTPRQAFEKKSELLDALLEKDNQLILAGKSMPIAAQDIPFAAKGTFSDSPSILTADHSETKALLHFVNGKKIPLHHQYAAEPKDGFAILQLAKRSSVSRRSHPFQANAEKEDDYKSLHIIIDNRGNHQHVAIEVKPSEFSTDAVAASLTHAFCEAFARYGLEMKIVPMREDKYFWKVVGDKERYPKGFKSLLVLFPQINDPEVSQGLNELGIGYHRQHFGTGLGLLHKSPKGENIPFDEKDAYQQAFMNMASLYGDKITLTPISGRSITFGGECAKTGEIPDTIIQNTKEKHQSQDLFEKDARSLVKEYMNKFYTK